MGTLLETCSFFFFSYLIPPVSLPMDVSGVVYGGALPFVVYSFCYTWISWTGVSLSLSLSHPGDVVGPVFVHTKLDTKLTERIEHIKTVYLCYSPEWMDESGKGTTVGTTWTSCSCRPFILTLFCVLKPSRLISVPARPL